MIKRLLSVLITVSILALTPVIAVNAAGTYTASLSSNTLKVSTGDSLSVNVNVSAEGFSDFSSSEMIIAYDSARLSFNQNASNLNGATPKDDGAGTILFENYGPSKRLGNAYTLVFTAISEGEATVTLVSAAFSDRETAEVSDLIPATIPQASKSITVTVSGEKFTVDLDPELFRGPSTVADGEDYTFSVSADGANYDYGDVSATVNGQSVTVIDNGDGTYTIKNVKGNVSVKGSRTPKKYLVTFIGEYLSSDGNEATYGEDFRFTLKADIPSGVDGDGKTYAISYIKIGGKEYKGYTYDSTSHTCVIPGKAITGDIEIAIETKIVPVNTYTVSINAMAGVVEGSYPVVVKHGDSHTITLIPQPGYTYTVSATMGNEEIEVVKGENNTYTVKNITGNVVITIKAEISSDHLSIESYLTLNGTNMWLILNKSEKLESGVCTVNGEKMFWSDKYQAYCFLIISKTMPEVVLGIEAGEAVIVDYSGDVDFDNNVSVNDAAFIRDLYNAAFSAFDGSMTVEMCLRADLNGSGSITVEDARAAVALIG